MRNKYLFLIIICLLGLGFRLWGLDKPLGLWNDEYIAWWISSFEFPEFFERMLNNCHMPLYYLLLKLWCSVFGDSDLSLRLSSVVTGLAAVVSMYFLGKEYKDEKVGRWCALLTAVSGFMIYFSQEVRPYSLIFLITTWIIFFFIKSLKNHTSKTVAGFVLFNFLLMFTHTIGFVFVFFNMIVFSFLMLKQKPQLKRAMLCAYSVLGVVSVPIAVFVYVVLTRDTISQNWGFLNFSRVFFVFTDYVTPIQLNVVNTPENVFRYLVNQNIFGSVLFFLCPCVAAAYFIVNGLREKGFVLRSLGLVALLYFAVLVVAAMLGKLVLTTKYSVEIYPIILLALGTGIELVWSRKLGKLLVVIYLLAGMFYLVFAPNAPQKLPRKEGHKAPALLLERAGITKDDTVIALYHQFYRYEKYMAFRPTVYNIDKERVAKYLMGEAAGETDLKRRVKAELREYFGGVAVPEIDERIDKIYRGLKAGEKVAIIVPLQVAFLSSGDLKRISGDDEQYRKAEIIFLAFSFAKIKLINEAVKYCDLYSVNELGTWAVVTFVKR